MKSAADESGTETHDVEVTPVEPDISSGTVTHRPNPALSLESASAVDEDGKTIISQRPVAAPEEFYRSMPLAELAGMLEGRQLDHFAVEQMIGGGGMGAVFRGRDERLDRTVAIKVIPAAKRDPETLRRFRLEAQAAAKLDHPNIARVYFIGEAERWNYIVFEFIDGVNIRDLVGMEGPLSVDDAIFYTRQVAEALQHAHEREVVHRDIKPSNILVTAAGLAKVVDMGLARSRALDKSTADATASGVTLGTFDYISPEQARNPRDADVRSDLYSLGCTLFFMLTGHPPFPEGTALQKLLNHGSLPPPDPRGWREDLSDQLYAILMKLMAKQPADRYQRPADLINDLLLLAQIEELPRSQSPGTMVFTPTIAQRTLLESNLPWIVAVAFLLGSSLWLQVQAISSDFMLPKLELPSPPSALLDPEADADSSSAVDNGAPVNDRTDTPELDLPDEPIALGGTDGRANLPIPTGLNVGPIVVSAFLPEDVEASRWRSTLDAVFSDFSGAEAFDIELRGEVALQQPLTLPKANVRIRGTDLGRDRILVDWQLLSETEQTAAAIAVHGRQLELSNLELFAETGNAVQDRRLSAVELGRDAKLLLRGCRMTFSSGLENSQEIAAVAVTATEEENAFAMEGIGNDAGVQVLVEDSFVRGQASFLRLWADIENEQSVELNFKNSLLAIEGFALDVKQTTDLGLAFARNIRTYCESSTFLTRAGFARMDFSDVSQPMLILNRTSHGCCFETDTGVPHLTIRGVSDQTRAGPNTWLLMKGNDNGYDATVRYLCGYFNSLDQETATLGFTEAIEEGWFQERGNQPVSSGTGRQQIPNLANTSAADFPGILERFSPGFRGWRSPR